MNSLEIKKAREYLGFYFSKDMAGALGVDIGTYHKWEKGKRKIPAVGIRAIKALVFIKDADKLEEFLNLMQST